VRADGVRWGDGRACGRPGWLVKPGASPRPCSGSRCFRAAGLCAPGRRLAGGGAQAFPIQSVIGAFRFIVHLRPRRSELALHLLLTGSGNGVAESAIFKAFSSESGVAFDVFCGASRGSRSTALPTALPIAAGPSRAPRPATPRLAWPGWACPAAVRVVQHHS
jgi:hypothetical protein